MIPIRILLCIAIALVFVTTADAATAEGTEGQLVTTADAATAEGTEDKLALKEATAGYCYTVQPWSMPPVLIYECPAG